MKYTVFDNVILPTTVTAFNVTDYKRNYRPNMGECNARRLFG